ncbi:MAG: hypothetical protein GTN40_00035 [Candidatus Aenigmarchaeota archaeon]|nr:hypothetical protein [Candidatus Aenigmarchaeota archaeon]
MRNIKIEKNWMGGKHWPNLAVVDVSGDPKATALPEGLSEEEKEKIIQSWRSIAVLKITPPVDVRVGYIHDNSSRFLKHKIETLDGMFGMRMGPETLKFIVIPRDLKTELKLELVGIISENSERYKNLPLY